MDAAVESPKAGGKHLWDEGCRFRGYLIEKEIGKGGIGAVYLARHEMLDSCFALKVLDPEVAASKPEYVKRFLREARIASKIRHPNLVTVHDAGYDEAAGLYYIVMDYVQGSNLRQVLGLSGVLEDKEAVRIVSHVASALDAAQRFGMVHRDIKPENIMLTPDGIVKLIDLGVAKVMGGIDTLKTMDKAVFGTPMYISPEQATDASTVDTRADIFSLGVVFFEMLAGMAPYKGCDTGEIVHRLLSSEAIPDVRTLNPRVSPKLAAVISLMCAKRADDRIASPSMLLDTFSRLGYPVPANGNAEYVDTGSDDFNISSYEGNAVESNDTLSFDTKDGQINEFVEKLKHKRLLKKIVRISCAILFISVVVLFLIFLMMWVF